MDHTRPIRHAEDGDAGLVLGQGRASDGHAQPASVFLADDPGAWCIGERAADVDRHAVLLGKLDRPGVHDPGSQAGQFEHLVVADAVDLGGLGHDPGVGGVNAVDIGVNLAGVGTQHRGQCDGRRVRTAPCPGS